MPALYSSQPKSTQRVVCPKSRPDQPDSLLDNNNDHSTVDHNLPPPVAAIVVLNSSPKKSLLSVDAIDSFDVPPPQPTLPIVCGHGSDASSGFSYVLEEDQPEPPTSQATSITASQYESIKLPGNQKAIVTNHFLYIDPSVFSLVWLNVTLFFILHSLYMYSFYIIYEEKKWPALIVGKLFLCDF